MQTEEGSGASASDMNTSKASGKNEESVDDKMAKIDDKNGAVGDDEAEADDGDPSASYSVGKKDCKGGKLSKKRRKHGSHLGGHHKAFKNSKGYEVFSKASPIPDDCDEEEVITNVVGKRPLLGKVWKDKTRGDYTRYRCYNYGIEYKPGESVYIDSQRPDQPYYICNIQDLKMSKRDTLMVHIKWYYRTNEVPEQVYQLLIQDRTTEHNTLNRLQKRNARKKKAECAEGNGNEGDDASSHKSGSSHQESGDPKATKMKKLDNRMLRMRELFISDATDVYPVSVLRGKCNVHHCQDIKALREFEPSQDTFFYTLAYNPETRRLASTQGEIRVGASHQAMCPEYLPDVPIEEREKSCHYGEDLMWEPGRIHDHDLLMYLRAARSMAAFAAMCDGGSPEDGFSAASRDGITANAIQVLHESDYNTGKALQYLLKCPYPANADVVRTMWSEDDIKDFIKGLRTYGKQFFKIRAEFLPDRDVSELVELYYMWKKTPGAANNRPRGRRHRPNVLRRIKPGKGGIGVDKEFKPSRDPEDPSSMSEGEESDGANENEEPSPYYCRHCFTSDSKDWHHAGKEKILVCTECRLYFKRYGEFPCLDPPGQESTSPEPESNDEELDLEDDVDLPTGVVKSSAKDVASALGGELNLTAIERDSDMNGDGHDIEDLSNGRNISTHVSGPVEIKGEPPPPKTFGLVSPVPTLPNPTHQLQSPSKLQQDLRRPSQMPVPLNMSTSSTNEVQVIGENLSIHHQQFQKQLHLQLHQQLGPYSSQQLSPSQRSNPSPPMPQTPREPTPPPKPDNTECHRSQSAIFTRNWNRGEGNSCARTDLFFKPVPDSKLARKREERLRKANAEQDAMKAAMSDSKLSRLDLPGHLQGPPSHGPPHNIFPDPFAQHAAALAGLGFSSAQSQMERLERERREQEMRASMAIAMSMAASPLTVTSSIRSPLGNPYGPPPPGFSAAHQHSLLAAAAAEGRRLEELAALSRERQFAALATDPLVRLQMAGVNPELPPVHHPAYGLLGPPPPGLGPRAQGSFPDPRFRSPGGAESLMRPGPMPSPGMEMLQRQLLLEREQSIRAAHGAVQASLLAQQEEIMRYEQERARHAAAIAASRPS